MAVNALPSTDLFLDEIDRKLRAPIGAIQGPTTENCLNWGITAGRTILLASSINEIYQADNIAAGLAVADTLGARIRALQYKAKIRPEIRSDAAKAATEAALFADRYFAAEKPSIDLTEDGNILLAWQRSDEGVVLLFVGDGSVVYSQGGNGMSYSAGVIERPVSAPPPSDIKDRIAEVSRV